MDLFEINAFVKVKLGKALAEAVDCFWNWVNELELGQALCFEHILDKLNYLTVDLFYLHKIYLVHSIQH